MVQHESGVLNLELNSEKSYQELILLDNDMEDSERGNESVNEDNNNKELKAEEISEFTV